MFDFGRNGYQLIVCDCGCDRSSGNGCTPFLFLLEPLSSQTLSTLFPHQFYRHLRSTFSALKPHRFHVSPQQKKPQQQQTQQKQKQKQKQKQTQKQKKNKKTKKKTKKKEKKKNIVSTRN